MKICFHAFFSILVHLMCFFLVCGVCGLVTDSLLMPYVSWDLSQGVGGKGRSLLCWTLLVAHLAMPTLSLTHLSSGEGLHKILCLMVVRVFCGKQRMRNTQTLSCSQSQLTTHK